MAQPKADAAVQFHVQEEPDACDVWHGTHARPRGGGRWSFRLWSSTFCPVTVTQQAQRSVTDPR